ncbi:MAG: diguanylate cyclase [Egibacteraceae bacterium]
MQARDPRAGGGGAHSASREREPAGRDHEAGAADPDVIVVDAEPTGAAHHGPPPATDAALLRMVLDTVPEGAMSVLDRDLRVIVAGGPLLERLGATPGTLTGAALEDVWPRECAERMRSACAAALDGADASFDCDLPGAVLRARVAPLREADGSVAAVLLSTHDVTTLREQRRRLGEAEERYRALTEVSTDEIGRFDRDLTLVYANESLLAALGLPELPTPLADLPGLPPGSVEAWRAALQRVLARGEPTGVQFTRDGRWLDARLSPEFSADGSVGHVVFDARDWSELKAVQDTLAARVAQQRALADLARASLAADDVDALLGPAVEVVAEQLRVGLCKVLELTDEGDAFVVRAGVGWRPGTLGTAVPWGENQATHTLTCGRPVLVSDSRDENRFAHTELLATHEVRAGMSAPIRTPRGPYGVLAVHTTEPRAFSDEDMLFLEAAAGLLGAALGRLEAQAALRVQALHDPLTGLANRALLLERIDVALAALSREGGLVALIFFDLDGFKAVNDALGHDAGDEVLCEVAERLEASMRPRDTLARFGGDEFVVLCEGLGDTAAAVALARRVVEAVGQPYRAPADRFPISASVGVATGGPGSTTDALLRVADEAMYRAKATGGDCVAVGPT